MGDSARRRARRSEGLPVRRWLQLGAASAGVGAGLMGFALLGPTGVAGAETAEPSAQSSSAVGDDARSADSTGADDTASADSGTSAGSATEAADADDEVQDAEDDTDPDDVDEIATDAEDLDDEEAAEETDASGDAEPPAATDTDAIDEVPIDEPESADDPDAVAAAATRASHIDDEVTPEPPRPPVPARHTGPDTWSEVVGASISNWTRSSEGWIRSLPINGAAKYHLEGALWATRRTFFNQAPTVAPIQITGELDGPIAGTVGAVDPDGDRLIYRLVGKPTEGTVALNADGTYTYTPGASFDGVDSFRVVAVDTSRGINLLDPFRARATVSTGVVNQRAITFHFNYTTGAEHWTPERRAALQDAADAVLVYFTVTSPVTITYTVMGENDPASHTLAWADSEYVSENPGFWRTVVQDNILSGVDANGAAADGEIAFNFGHKWGLGNSVAADEYDFASTAIHELLHSFGFGSSVTKPGENQGDARAIYDSFLRTADGDRPITASFEWDSDYDPNLLGRNGGLYFAGENAVTAHGALVPLFTPDPWAPGSSMHHLDDFTFTGDNQKIMNARTDKGLGIRVLSPMELGILRDLGFRVDAPAPGTLALAFIGVLFIGRLRKKMTAASN
ncbi:hypothetical protein E4P42_19515 [Mycobacterium sp. PS03-16]|nr:hypothetical protein E4P42_19515 [Mycobacterium sp. PS03-16]